MINSPLFVVHRVPQTEGAVLLGPRGASWQIRPQMQWQREAVHESVPSIKYKFMSARVTTEYIRISDGLP